MKRIFFFAIFIFLLGACEETAPNPNLDKGVITGYDLRFCPCCGGVFIEIQNDTFRYYTVPDTTFQFTANDLPLNVLVDWSPQANQCLGDEIDIFHIEKE